jgi:ribonuclease P protein component
LSTVVHPDQTSAVDDSPFGRWLGLLVPKRHARRATTRNLVKRSIRAAARQHAHGLDAGMWIVRLRGAFATERFVSASSPALRSAVLGELEALFARAIAA